ncbi:hypothetical protein DPMN_170088 [Dreissena polymorpha]|uniref:Uncharacterized protein n=1 Tax=Dreissena polymorpha TaxID=45954 RepID=A0A9D4DZ54_DREPO|nr:hypothetical protein DPMN_170088 [Dreissena polymorpha]
MARDNLRECKSSGHEYMVRDNLRECKITDKENPIKLKRMQWTLIDENPRMQWTLIDESRCKCSGHEYMVRDNLRECKITDKENANARIQWKLIDECEITKENAVDMKCNNLRECKITDKENPRIPSTKSEDDWLSRQNTPDEKMNIWTIPPQ